ILVPFRSSSAIAEAVLRLIENEAERQAMRKRAYLFARGMTWPRVADRYVELVESLLEDRAVRPRWSRARPVGSRSEALPPLKLDHMQRLTDATGILQHAVFIAPNYDEGYTTDDNARALIVTALLEELGRIEGGTVLDLAARYLAFLWHAFNPRTGRFRNFMSYDRRWREDVGSGDSHGRALWALGTLLGRSRHEALRGTAARLFDSALPAAEQLTSPRAAAFALLGLQEYARRLAGDRVVRSAGTTLADRLVAAYETHRSRDWEWFEDVLTYANATVPHALVAAGVWLEREELVEVGLRTLGWLRDLQVGEAGQLVPIGTEGFHPRGGARARFDQQPLEAQAMVSACVAAYQATGDDGWRREARRAFDWFLGHNDLGLPLYDSFTGGCRDGLHAHGVNQNQGAESTLAVLQSRIELQLLEEASAVTGAARTLEPPRERPVAEERAQARPPRRGLLGWKRNAREPVRAE
ncbi:MAG TPA: hypothetical protein VFQ22_03005, partial [Longimicrobiales bacterium]|nr:hypothetical protein [Longimicrobiales bacterium]